MQSLCVLAHGIVSTQPVKRDTAVSTKPVELRGISKSSVLDTIFNAASVMLARGAIYVLTCGHGVVQQGKAYYGMGSSIQRSNGTS